MSCRKEATCLSVASCLLLIWHTSEPRLDLLYAGQLNWSSSRVITSRLERNCDSKAAILLSKPTDGFPLLGLPAPFKLVITLFR